jgi:penicillin-binding protein 1A
MPHVLAMALGAGETTVLRMTAAYATIANGGRKITPTLIDRIQDRYGDTIYRHDERICQGCEQAEWNGQGTPTIIDSRQQVLDPMTAYQVTSMLEGVVQRGTGTVVRSVGRPVAGKTGTTNDYKDAWFVGFTPELAVGVYVGYDRLRRSLPLSFPPRSKACRRRSSRCHRACIRTGSTPRRASASSPAVRACRKRSSRERGRT